VPPSSRASFAPSCACTRRLPARLRRRLLVQGPRLLPFVWRPPHGRHRRTPRRSGAARGVPLPFALPYRLAYDAPLVRDLLENFVRCVFASPRRRAREQWGIARGLCGAVTFARRFGDALNLNVHFRSLVLDGVYSRSESGAPGRTPRGSSTRARGHGEPDDPAVLQGERCASVGGVSVHANVAVPARDRRRLERLCRYGASRRDDLSVRPLLRLLRRRTPSRPASAPTDSSADDGSGTGRRSANTP